MPTLRLIFGGLLAFVPVRTANGEDGMYVFAPQARDPREAIGYENPRAPILSAHFPVLRYKQRYRHNDSPRKADWVIGRPTEELEDLILLKDERLFIYTQASNPTPFDIQEDPIYDQLEYPDIHAPSDEEYERQRTDFRWVPPLKLANPLCKNFDQPCAQHLASVSLAVELFEGKVRTHKLAGEPVPPGSQREFFKFDFEATETERAIAEEVEVEANCARRVRIKSKLLDADDVEPDLWLKASAGKIELRIEHFELEGIFKAPIGDRRVTVEDFLLFYELAERRPDRWGRDIPYYNGEDDGGPAGPRICTTARFSKLNLEG